MDVQKPVKKKRFRKSGYKCNVTKYNVVVYNSDNSVFMQKKCKNASEVAEFSGMTYSIARAKIHNPLLFKKWSHVLIQKI